MSGWPEFQHEAMATNFSIVIAEERSDYARQAAAAAFRELDRLESVLSRFVESSDIAGANRLRSGESVVIGEDALQCLLLAAAVAEDTSHAFDAAYASMRENGAPAGEPCFTVDPGSHVLTSRATRLQLDLGAIGKGYALDRMAEILGEWSISRACLQSGGSTALAVRAPADQAGWPVGLGDTPNVRTINLSLAALSGSGIAVKGEHLIDPRTGAPPGRRSRVWSLAGEAAVADALSTAFFVMTETEIESYCRRRPEMGAAWISGEGSVIAVGALRDLLARE